MTGIYVSSATAIVVAIIGGVFTWRVNESRNHVDGVAAEFVHALHQVAELTEDRDTCRKELAAIKQRLTKQGHRLTSLEQTE